MDNVTHTLFALTLARTPLGRAGRGTTAALILASNAPDVDIVTAIPGGFVTYLRWHRGPTHGLLGIVGLGLVSAAIVWAFNRVSGARGLVGRRSASGRDGGSRASGAPASFLMLTAVSEIGIVLHVLMDLPTSYGTRLLSPFDWRWFAVDWMPIIDIY
ncbi:MAG TPA: metal-dependent hydrolase, partial [Vicinamibacterales bacterium]|nr:metal-dependent hydrolase [Vicinamibacterales bacterium]